MINLEGKFILRGVRGEVDIINTKRGINIKKGYEDYLKYHKIPVLLGREVFFDEFNITFEQIKEKVILKKISSFQY